MTVDHRSLQELIVRALTGMDQRARQSLEAATAKDPELKKFCSELDEVVNLLAGSKDWRAEPPSAELTAKIRVAVAQKLQSAPPHFRAVMLKTNLSRRHAIISVIILAVTIAALLGAIIIWLWLRHPVTEIQWQLSGNIALDETFKNSELLNWEQQGAVDWRTDADGLHAEEGDEPIVLYLNKAFAASSPLALEIDVSIPELDEQSTMLIFLAERPIFDERYRPIQALTLDISRNSLVLLGAEQQLLHSLPISNTTARFYRLRLEHLGARVRMLINGQVSFDGCPGRSLRGMLYPGIRVSGPLKNKILFNKARLER